MRSRMTTRRWDLFRGGAVGVALAFGAACPAPAAAPVCQPYEPVVYFHRGQTVLSEEDPGHAERMARLRAFAAWTLAQPGYPVTVVGHSDSVGSAEEEARASTLRAEAVRAALIDFGVAADLIQIRGDGNGSPPWPMADEIREPRANRVQLFSGRPNCE